MIVGATAFEQARECKTAQGAAAALWCVLIALACCLACLAVPESALGYYNEYDTKNSAQQDIGQLGERIPASAVPEGVYSINATSTSRMCVIYETAQDAAALDNKWHATLVSQGGQLAVVFFLSKSYTDIYLGTAEQAASLSDATGTDYSAYIQGDPYQVSTADGTRNVFQYTLSIPSLNSLVTMATFDGGGSDGINLNIASAKWYNRQIAFLPSQELIDAMNGKGGSQGQKSPQGDTADESSSADAGRQTQDAAQTQGGGQAQDQAAQHASESEENQAADEGQANPVAANAQARHGVLLVASAYASQGLGDQVVSVQGVVEEQKQTITPEQILGMAVMAALVVGAVLRVALFAASKRT